MDRRERCASYRGQNPEVIAAHVPQLGYIHLPHACRAPGPTGTTNTLSSWVISRAFPRTRAGALYLWFLLVGKNSCLTGIEKCSISWT
ncbi:hypothetical protein LTLLF_172435 [Microtus ochrogaster]|uniref:Uncharacterized protein n=1 Tax=Microtus ochrogaster TaxID=79684 RepID=A0A8J6G7N8_MICOH|nr:hypothetical protein LTLLF_172435 [Microtus ochrogaster]